jgi:preprotein translocase subunit SecB
MSYKIIGKYIKDLNFSIPNPKTFFLLSKNISSYKINIDIKSNQVKQNFIEVFTSLSLTPVKEDFERINTKIVFATLVELSNEKMEKQEIEKIVLIEVPTKIYSDLRNIFVSLFESSGFKDIKISENIDFQELYKMRKTQ